VPAAWRTVARDGADLPGPMQVLRAAPIPVAVGQTADAEADLLPGAYRLVMRRPDQSLAWEQTLRIR